MPRFSTVSISEARAKSATGKRAALLQEYIQYIQRAAGEAGVLEAGEGETTQAIRRRLALAAEALGTSLEVKRSGDAVFFWTSNGRRRGRRSKAEIEGEAE